MLKNKNILITGGGSGIGESLAIHLAKENKVVICGRNEDKLIRVAGTNKNISYYVSDLSLASEIESLFEKIANNKIQLDVLFNNAGVFEEFDVKTVNFSSQQIFEKININLSAPIALTRHFVKQADSSDNCYIVNITAELALFPVPLWALYAASKTALSVFTKLLRQQLKGTNFRVVEILPPAIDTPMSRTVGHERALPSPADFAGNVVRVINKGKLEYAPGKNVPILKFFSRFMPQIGLNIVDKATRKFSQNSNS
ncbi:SDR family NAD(P)-dependent oxidoreductase [Pedobacter miscanthi]|uniref:SDR family NAD(P)-dependent oxidoreductase n=1 Tax=Pedobacter miscanthi TaxID=2259170 RepID=UPI00292F3D77|nr:SDR family NAD(P)-dependent oxidoreductase [Pedobacter miscanthi]